MGMLHFPIGRDLPLPESTSRGCAGWFAEGLNSEKASDWHNTAAIASLVGLGILSLVTVIGLPFYAWLIKSIAFVIGEKLENKQRERDIETRKTFIETLGGEAAVAALPPQFELNFSISKGAFNGRDYVALHIYDLEKKEFFIQCLVECAENRKFILDGSDPRVQEFLLFPEFPPENDLRTLFRTTLFPRPSRLWTRDDQPIYHNLGVRRLSQATLQTISEIITAQHPRFILSNAFIQRLVQPLAI